MNMYLKDEIFNGYITLCKKVPGTQTDYIPTRFVCSSIEFALPVNSRNNVGATVMSR